MKLIDTNTTNLRKKIITSPRLPLAVYREIAAHLRQLTGLSVGFFPQQDRDFDYLQSQVGGLWLEYSPETHPDIESKIEAILDYYAQKYQSWSIQQSLSSNPALCSQ